MFAHFANLTRRSEGPPAADRTMVTLLVVLLVLLIIALFLVAGLLYLRYRRKARKQSAVPPPYDDEEKRMSSISTTSSHRRVMVRPSESVHVYEKQTSMENLNSPPASPLPEIHITFPEEIDDSGKRTSGRVVVVRVGDNGVGLEPVEGLPAYQTDDKRFESLDLERIGGLVEKARNAPSYDKFEKL
ncbi:hypothetical protein Slin14017_G027440 [Septoria linicola]|nr:hypothetical protein Slin14017_G027440 [Septoria linicola]